MYVHACMYLYKYMYMYMSILQTTPLQQQSSYAHLALAHFLRTCTYICTLYT